ncbi:hypothetical protein B005_2427 [Nocardiopsis alba ATCC BAA-2165]|uniref:Uncharacterized protein n=1 Tax=Nocardiopsis alba (strain ATCC BAA-2165 / BE74) TaxID=1205910 RepID=J7L9Z7_NOCAA|nr:hypothetical protein B005_2427 [Nocardiopsis alba ATCC BAA-2165]
MCAILGRARSRRRRVRDTGRGRGSGDGSGDHVECRSRFPSSVLSSRCV